MGATLTIRNLDEAIKHKLRILAATHGRSMEAEAREILLQGVGGKRPQSSKVPRTSKGKFDRLVGIWKGRMSTDEIMKITRGE